jgi:hypothetical protein
LSPVIKLEPLRNIKIEEYAEDDLPLVGGWDMHLWDE